MLAGQRAWEAGDRGCDSPSQGPPACTKRAPRHDILVGNTSLRLGGRHHAVSTLTYSVLTEARALPRPDRRMHLTKQEHGTGPDPSGLCFPFQSAVPRAHPRPTPHRPASYIRAASWLPRTLRNVFHHIRRSSATAPQKHEWCVATAPRECVVWFFFVLYFFLAEGNRNWTRLSSLKR